MITRHGERYPSDLLSSRLESEQTPHFASIHHDSHATDDTALWDHEHIEMEIRHPDERHRSLSRHCRGAEEHWSIQVLWYVVDQL